MELEIKVESWLFKAVGNSNQMMYGSGLRRMAASLIGGVERQMGRRDCFNKLQNARANGCELQWSQHGQRASARSQPLNKGGFFFLNRGWIFWIFSAIRKITNNDDWR